MIDAQAIFSGSKIVHHQDRLGPYVESRRTASVPVTMEMDLTNICSHRCPSCAGRRMPESAADQLFTVLGDGRSIPEDRAANYIVQIARAGVKGLIFTGGGEPTVHPAIQSLIYLARASGMDVGLVTHGGLLHKLDIDRLVTDCTWIRVSIDAVDEKQFLEVHGRQRDEWLRVWNNVEKISSSARRLKGAGQTAATIGVGYLTGPEDISKITVFARLAKQHGVDYAQIRPFHHFCHLDAEAYVREASERFDSETFHVVGSNHKYVHIHNGDIEPRNYSQCHFANFASVICANEKLYVCCHHRNVEAFCIGNLREESFIEIVQGDRRNKVTESVNVGRCQPLCRGDHMNRDVEQIANGGLVSLGPTPPHVNFL